MQNHILLDPNKTMDLWHLQAGFDDTTWPMAMDAGDNGAFLYKTDDFFIKNNDLMLTK